MILTNYWWLIIWLMACGMILPVIIPVKQIDFCKMTIGRWHWSAIFILIFPYIIWCMNRSGFADTEVYRSIFYEVPDRFLELQTYLSSHEKDQGFVIMIAFLKHWIGNHDRMFFLIIASFQMVCVVSFFRAYAEDFWLCFYMFIASTDYLSWMMNGMRQFIAVSILLLSFRCMIKKHWILTIALIFLASSIHASAFLMLPLMIIIQGKAWNKKTVLLLAGILLMILLMNRSTFLLDQLLMDTQYSGIIEGEIWQHDNGTHPFRVLFYSLPALLSLVGKDYIDEANAPVLNLCVNCSICTAAMYLLSAFSSGIYIGRLPILTTLQGYIIVPWLIHHMFTKKSAIVVKILFIGLYFLFFYYQMHIAWHLI